jgi:hypothetical protein
MNPYDAYIYFLCLKQHYTKLNYDVFKYNWKTRASITSYNKRKDRYFFERLSRKYSEQEIKEFFISNFAYSDNVNGVYVPDLVETGEEVYSKWKKYTQSLFYNFKTELEVFFSHLKINEIMECRHGQHSALIRKYLQKTISLETLVIFNYVLNYVDSYDKILDDPVWESLSLKIKKYSPFIHINREKYIELMKETFCE